MERAHVAWDDCTMRYAFHGHESELELKDVISFEPELANKVARIQGEPNVEDAVAVVLDVFGAAYVREQRAHLETIGKSWLRVAPLARDGTENDKERVRAIPDRLGFRFDAVWREGRASLHLMLRSIALRHGCDVRDAALYVDDISINALMEELVDGLRKGFARSIDAAVAVECLERATGGQAKHSAAERPASTESAARLSKALEIDWAAEIVRTSAEGNAILTAP